MTYKMTIDLTDGDCEDIMSGGRHDWNFRAINKKTGKSVLVEVALIPSGDVCLETDEPKSDCTCVDCRKLKGGE